MKLTVPIRVQSEANLREHFRVTAKRKKAQRKLTRDALEHTFPRKRHVHLVRIGPRDLDDDNLASGFKAIRDEVAAWLGADDRPGSGITWSYGQERGRPREYAARVEITEGEQ